MSAHDPQFRLRSALLGFEGARQRFLVTATPSAQAEDVFVPLTEALWWAVSVDEGFEALAGSRVSQYRARRNDDPCGRALRPLRFARHRSGHQRAIVAMGQPLTLPFRLPAVLGVVFRWLPTSELPPVSPRHHEKEHELLRQEYDSILAGRPAQEALEFAAKWFDQERAGAGI